MKRCFVLLTIFASWLALSSWTAQAGIAAPQAATSHPPLRPQHAAAQRPLATGPAFFADSKSGDDANIGSQEKPWRTIRHAMTKLAAGDTLYLRAGVFYENVYCALAGRSDAPITVRSFPGEVATIDGGLREFLDAPQTAWEPVGDGANNEFRSRQRYPNLRDVVGYFGDSMIGLQTYYQAIDLRAEGELFDWPAGQKQSDTDIAPIYLGPGLWYNRQTGHIHARLSHTHLPAPVANYAGATDPRQLPLIVAPFHSLPLHLDHADHVRFQDLQIRGAGYTTILLDHAAHVEFDNVTVWCGTYGIRASRTTHLKVQRCGFHGSLAPWTFRSDASKRDYPGRPHRNLSRLNTHAIVEIESGLESSVFATPQNDHWEFSYCDFTDAHDGVYLGGINARFHHNLIENLQDDGVYLSPMYLRHRLDKTDPQIHVYQNLFRGLLTAVAFGGPEGSTHDRVWIYRNVFDLRPPVRTSRGTTADPTTRFSSGQLMGDHGSPPWPAMNIYHNTVVLAEAARGAAMAAIGSNKAGHTRRVFNNVFLHLNRFPGYSIPATESDEAEDGNVFGSTTVDAKAAAIFFNKFRNSEAFTASKKLLPDGSSAHSVVADPQLNLLGTQATDQSDYRLGATSGSKGVGILLPADWPDPLRPTTATPDAGAVPADGAKLQAGRRGG